jgi:hypothetical protein
MRNAVARPTDRKAGDRLRPSLGVFTGNHREHPRKFLGLRNVDAFDARVGMRAAQDGREQHAGKGNIVTELSSARKQCRIFNPRRIFAQVARLGQRQLTQISWHFLAQVDQPLFIWFFQVYCEDVFTTKDTKSTKFGVLMV